MKVKDTAGLALRRFILKMGFNTPPLGVEKPGARGICSHMRLLRDKQPIKRREPFSFSIGAKNHNVMYIF
ncbi:MAG: hypothetical protein LBG43_01405 [Treponema sp.]|jgi:hypothetical protein|nr:hypothetical protein [Treponema sp.]